MNYDMQSFYEEFLNKIRDDQARFDENAHDGDTGALADVVPFDGIGGNPGCPVWQVAYIVIARQMWKHHGEDALPSLRSHYRHLNDLMDWFDRHADPTDGLLVTSCYGDWMGFKPESGNGGGSLLTPPASITAFYHVLAMTYLSELATAVGDVKGEAKRRMQYKKGRAAWHKRFFSQQHGGYSPCLTPSSCHGTSLNGSQTSNAMGLVIGAPPDDATADRVANNLAADVMAFGNRTTAGVVGMAWVFPMLDAHGYGDVALATLLNDAYPSIGHMAHQNMTTLCENLACTFHAAGGGSQNHIMLGGFDAWLLSSIGGLDSAVNGTSSGWREIVARVSPAAVTMIKSAEYTKTTRFGDAGIRWHFDGSQITSHIEVPIGSELALHTPTALAGRLGLVCVADERGSVLWSQKPHAVGQVLPGVLRTTRASDAVVITLSSGNYTIRSSYHALMGLS